MTSRGHVSELSKLAIVQRALTSLLVFVLSFAAYPQCVEAQDQPAPSEARPAPQYTQQTPEELQRLVAPIALYPDSLVAQILGASTFPEQVVDADRWVQSHPDVRDAGLAQAVDQLPWDPSVKALVAFPSVLGSMDKNLSWTSSLGDAYYNQEQDVIDAVQVMRRRAQEAGHLNSTPQQTVITQSSEIVIEPVSPEIVYVPAYDPWVVYGEPVAAWGGWYPYPGIWVDGPLIAFGVGFGVGYFGDYGWGWHHWGCDWHHHYAVHDHGGITRQAGPSITATDSIEAKPRVACTTVRKGHPSLSPAATELLAAMPSLVVGARLTSVPSTPTAGRPAATRNPAARATLVSALSAAKALLTTEISRYAPRAASAQAPSVDTGLAETSGAFRHAGAPASAAGAALTVADATERIEP